MTSSATSTLHKRPNLKEKVLATLNWACGIQTKNQDFPQLKPKSEAEQEFQTELHSKLANEQAFSNPLILKKILGFLDNTEDLLNCRGVCSDWKSIANGILHRRKSVTISLVYDEKSKAYFKGENKSCSISKAHNSRPKSYAEEHKDKEFPLKNLLRVIKSTAGSGPGQREFQFPCTSFQITVGDSETKDLCSFLQLYGKWIENLGLDLNHYFYENSKSKVKIFPKIETVQNILCGTALYNLKELEILDIKENQFPWNRREEEGLFFGDESFTFAHLFQEFPIQVDSAEKETKMTLMMIAKLPNLEKLRFDIRHYHDFHTDYHETFRVPRKILVQKNITESKSVEFCGLDAIQLTCKDCVSAVVSSNKLIKIGKLSINDIGLGRLEKILELCSSQLHFDHLVVDFPFDVLMKWAKNSKSMKKQMIRVLNTIFNIIEKNCEPKVCISIDRPIGILSDADLDLDFDFEIPVLKNVSSLQLQKPDCESADDSKFPANINFFPCDFSLSNSFPNLESIVLKKWTGDISINLWGQNCQRLPTVKNFRLFLSRGQSGQESGFSKLPEIFPKLRRIEIRHFMNFPVVAHWLWKFKELEDLKIGLDVSKRGESGSSPSHWNSNELGAIDSAITGFTMETCQTLGKSEQFLEWTRNSEQIQTAKDKEREKTDDQEEREKNSSKFSNWPSIEIDIDIENLRVNPSICDLPNLRKFSLTFLDLDFSLNKSYFLISELSGLFAFSLMPQLEVEMDRVAQFPENQKRMVEQLERMIPFMKNDLSG